MKKERTFRSFMKTVFILFNSSDMWCVFQCEMEESSSQKLVWDGDAKAVQQCLTDIFTSVYTTCDIPENAIFGPCVLSHTSLYDSIAFIALKSTDKRTAPYIFRVSTFSFRCLFLLIVQLLFQFDFHTQHLPSSI